MKHIRKCACDRNCVCTTLVLCNLFYNNLIASCSFTVGKATLAASTMMKDCFGNNYKICDMPSTGFCGFRALSHCLTGNQLSYAHIIEDCVNAFANIPQLFRLRTNFGTRNDSSSTSDDYAVLTHDAVQQVDGGHSVDNETWCEDGHLAAVVRLTCCVG